MRAIIAALLFTGSLLADDCVTVCVEPITVPNLIGMTISNARLAWAAAGGDSGSVLPDDICTANTCVVYAQSIDPGETVCYFVPIGVEMH